jgi:Gram-negative bacterial TonB protein C-terminal
MRASAAWPVGKIQPSRSLEYPIPCSCQHQEGGLTLSRDARAVRDMGLNCIRIAVFIAATGFTSAMAYADGSISEPPEVNVLPCIGACANSTGAVPIFTPGGDYSGTEAFQGVDGLAAFLIEVGLDGKVQSIKILQLLGPADLANSARQAVMRWVYKPATLNGKPVVQSRIGTMIFVASHDKIGLHYKARQIYETAYDLVQQQMTDQVYDLIRGFLSTQRMTFFERGMLMNMLAPIELQRGRYLDLLDQVKPTLDFFAWELPSPALQNLLKFRIAADFAVGNAADAVSAADMLHRIVGADPNGVLAQMVQQKLSEIDVHQALATQSRIPAEMDGEGVYLALYRRDFQFRVDSGALTRFSMSCRQQTIESSITEGAEWHVPKDWDDCHLLVEGTPGTTFQLVQLRE